MAGQETQIKNCVLDWLKYKGIFAFMVNTQGNFNKFSQSYYHNPRLMKGVADIICLYEGKFIAIECKAGKGKQSEHQREFEKMVKANGGDYILAYGLEAVEKYF